MVGGSPQVFTSYHRAELGVAGRLRAHLVVVTEFTVDLVGPLAAITAAATAWTQLGRNVELAKRYRLAAQISHFSRVAVTLQGLQRVDELLSCFHLGHRWFFPFRSFCC
jgi:hypothetical protein